MKLTKRQNLQISGSGFADECVQESLQNFSHFAAASIGAVPSPTRHGVSGVAVQVWASSHVIWHKWGLTSHPTSTHLFGGHSESDPALTRRGTIRERTLVSFMMKPAAVSAVHWKQVAWAVHLNVVSACTADNTLTTPRSQYCIAG